MTHESRRPVWSLPLGLFAVSLILLALGHFIQLDDVSGFGSDRWVLPLGILALVAAVCGLSLAGNDRSSQVASGVFLLMLDVGLVVAARVDDGFRFVWLAGEVELVILEVLVGVVGLLLLWKPADRPGELTPARSRVILYVVGLVLLVGAALVVGTVVFEVTQCGNGGECDLSFLGGIGAAVVVAPLWVVGAVANEVRLALRARRG